MLPPSPDRFPPRLAEIEAQNRTKLYLKFNEAIDAKTISKDNFLITASTKETLMIKEITTGRKSDIITLITDKQSPIRYSLWAKVTDLEGNWAQLQTRFLGSGTKDTISPRILEIKPKAGATEQKKNVRIEFRFSEEIDTMITAAWAVLPIDLKTRFQTNWQPDYRQLTFTLKDSLGGDTVVYFILLRSVLDFEGNRLLAPGFTFFTSDSVLKTKLLTGTVKYKDRPMTEGLVIFDQTQDSIKSVALAPLDSFGSFAIQIKDGIYDVKVIADTNFDDRIDLTGKILGFNTTTEQLFIEVFPDSLAKNLDWYLR